MSNLHNKTGVGIKRDWGAESGESRAANLPHLHQIIPGQQRKPDMLHQFGHVLQTSRLIVLDPRYHRLKHLRDGQRDKT